ncbi:MAG: outer membrane protein assembly factor BamA [Planctomycetes bacterium]|nr:outer membrane protein assembly factor BamA [Planctomycetota bacterium]
MPIVFALFALGLSGPSTARAQDEAADGMPVRKVEIVGLKEISEGFVRRTIKTRESQPYMRSQLQEDVRELLRTRKFLDVRASAKVDENQVVATFYVAEKSTIAGLEIEGNKVFKTDDLFKELPFAAGGVLDRFDVNSGRERIISKYKEKGYYYVAVEVDDASLSENRVLYRVTEGPRVRVRQILFEGANSFPEPQLKFKLRTKTYFPILSTGAFDEEQAERDAAELQQFYREEGFLDARVGYRLDFQDVERTRLSLVFVIEEGRRYRIADFRIDGATVFDAERIRSVFTLRIGDFLRTETLRADVKKVEDLYGEIGYVDVRAVPSEEFVEQADQVNVVYQITEGVRSRFGRITIRGNEVTKDEVVRRELRFYPGEDYNTVKAREGEKRVSETGLFSKATITPLEDIEGEREALVEVAEAETSNFLFGVGVSADNGIIGSVTIENRNFDLLNWPRTRGEVFKAWKGDGQRARIVLEPGTEVTRFRIEFTEPYLFDKQLRFDSSLYLFQRNRTSYDEERYGFVPAISKRFDSGLMRDWAVEGALRFEGIDISDLRDFAARDIRDVKGTSTLTSLKGTLVHDTTDSRFVATKGHRFYIGWEQVGALGGDYDFGKPTAGVTWYKTMSTDAFDRKSVLALRADTGLIVGEAPVFERFYGGGFGSIRGFSFRGVSPRDGVYNDRTGGDFVLLTGAEYSFPLYADNFRGVTFLDMGTVERDIGITSWRASVGFGLRINIKAYVTIPLVLDFGFPIAKDDQDDTQVFNFNFGASF